MISDEMARKAQAAFMSAHNDDGTVGAHLEAIRAALAAVLPAAIQAEREACAAICDADGGDDRTLRRIAAAIRARLTQEKTDGD